MAIIRTGRAVQVTYPSGLVVKQVRDFSGWLTALTDGGGNNIYQIQSWQGNVQPAVVLLGNNITVANQYDVRGRLTGSRAVRSTDNTVLTHMRYVWDPVDNLLARQYVHRQGRADLFTYDAGERVSQAQMGAVPTIVGAAARPEGAYFPSQPGLGAGLYARAYAYDQGGLDLLASDTTLQPSGLTPPRLRVPGAARTPSSSPPRWTVIRAARLIPWATWAKPCSRCGPRARPAPCRSAPPSSTMDWINLSSCSAPTARPRSTSSSPPTCAISRQVTGGSAPQPHLLYL